MVSDSLVAGGTIAGQKKMMEWSSRDLSGHAIEISNWNNTRFFLLK